MARAESVSLEPVKDNTLYEDEEGALSNGKGKQLFAGRIAQQGGGRIRRALIAFDIASLVPAGATITAATLEMNMSMTIVGDEDVSLHRVLADWGEGESEAEPGREGRGGMSAPGDATWIHRFFDATTWATAGGDFEAEASATTTVGFQGGYTWGSTPAMVADVQAWLDQPQDNFGWIVVGNEAQAMTAKAFDSRQSPEELRPRLTIDFVVDATPSPTGTVPSIPSETPTATAVPTATPTEASTDTPTTAPTSTATPTDTPIPTASPTPTDSATPTPTETLTATPTVTDTPLPTATDTRTATPTEPPPSATATATEPPPSATPTATQTLAPTASPTQAGRRCVGDCDADGTVVLAETVLGVRIALGQALLSACAGLDANEDERAEVAELVAAVDSSFGCAPACLLPNPQGCRREGCPPGFVCDLTVGCEPSSCFCDDDSGQWSCTEDCGGGTCESESE